MAKRIVLSDVNKVNSKGYRIDLSGMNTENKNETQEIPSDSGQNAVETVGSGKSEPTEKTAQRDRIAKDIFVKNSCKSVLYFTNDMIPFFEKTDAIKHSKGLDNKTIVTINKE